MDTVVKPVLKLPRLQIIIIIFKITDTSVQCSQLPFKVPFLYILAFEEDVPCKSTTLGTEYRGVVAWTNTGKTCQRWDSQSPHVHNMNNPDLFPDATLADAENYCRNPNNEGEGPWCYTMDLKSPSIWEYCSVDLCPGKLQNLYIHV